MPLAMRMLKSYIRAESEVEISFPKYRILSEIQSGMHTVSSLAEVICVSRPAISKIIDSLVEENYIVRLPSKEDRRVVHLKISPAGKKVFKKVRKTASQKFVENLDDMKASELKVFMKSLECIEKFVNRKR